MPVEFASLEDVQGAPSEKRSPETQAAENTARPTHYRKGEEKPRLQQFVDNLTNSLPISKEDSNYKVELTEVRKETPSVTRVTENFTGGAQAQAPPAQENGQLGQQVARILRLVEQNRTGQETTASQDMILQIFTGVLFLFTFDSFVTLGRQMK